MNQKRHRYTVGYKVVAKRTLRSSYVIEKEIKYSTKKFVRPKIEGTKLFAFATLEEAKRYAQGSRFAPTKTTCSVYKAKLRNPKKVAYLTHELSQKDIIRFFRATHAQQRAWFSTTRLPALAADSIKLLKRAR